MPQYDLLRAVKSVGRTGETPLHIAVSKGHEGCLRALLELGASLEAADHHAHTALHWAAASGQQGCLRVLLERGASLAAIDCNGLTAVALAAGKGQSAEQQAGQSEAVKPGFHTPELACQREP